MSSGGNIHSAEDVRKMSWGEIVVRVLSCLCGYALLGAVVCMLLASSIKRAAENVVPTAHARETERSALMMRSMPFWKTISGGHTEGGRTKFDPERLRELDEEVRNQAMDWLLERSSDIRVLDQDSHWERFWVGSTCFAQFTVTIYYIEER